MTTHTHHPRRAGGRAAFAALAAAALLLAACAGPTPLEQHRAGIEATYAKLRALDSPVRDAAPLLASHHYSGSYMQDALRDPSETSPADVSPELSKHFRALRMWLPLVLLGTGPFRAALEEKLLLARYFHAEIGRAGYEVGPLPDLSIVTYRWAPPGADTERLNAINQAIVEGSRRDGRIFLSSTMLDGRFTLRMAALAFRTHRRTIDLAVRVLREQAAAVGHGQA